MTEDSTAAGARALLARHGLKPKKSWGQNFLTDTRVLARIAEATGVGPEDRVVEIGAGLGALTRALAARGARVTAIERDPELVAVLRAELAGDEAIEVVAEDALAYDFAAAAARAAVQRGRPLVVAGNLPYQITTPLLFRVLEATGGGAGPHAGAPAVARAVFMVQREVAERIAAAPGSKSYGRLSVMLQQAAEVKLLFHVKPGAFLPPPQVTSTVFSLTPRREPLAPVEDARLFAAVVRAAFGGRRKMLRRSLEPAFGGDVAARALAEAGVEGTRRAEELAVAEFARVANALGAAGVRGGTAAWDGDGDGDGDGDSGRGAGGGGKHKGGESA
jgi:16S rRNA (adenine1518-N6/adenine1519-N6)-dimethyltransferase